MTRVIICNSMIENLGKLNPKTDEERETVRNYMSWLKSELQTSEGMVLDKLNQEQFQKYHEINSYIIKHTEKKGALDDKISAIKDKDLSAYINKLYIETNREYDISGR